MALFHRHTDGVLTSISWERSIDIEHQEWVTKKSKSEPFTDDDVRNVREEQQAHWEEDEYRPITIWRYEELDWRPGRTVTASGTSHEDVQWPSYTLEDNERTGEQHETYVAVFEMSHDGPGSGKPGKTRKGELDEWTWRSLQLGASYHLEIGVLGGVKAAVPATS